MVTKASIKSSGKVTLQILGLSVISFVLLGITIAIFGESGEFLVVPNPFTSGFVHSGFGHLSYNLLLIFIFTLFQINSGYDIKKLYWITFIISCLYLPISLLGITTHAIGVSGTCYFLVTRAIFGSRDYKIFRAIFMCIFGLIILGEFINMSSSTSDGIAHGVHFIGAILGLISLYVSPKLIPYKIRKVIL